VAARVQAGALAELAARQDVARVTLDERLALLEESETHLAPAPGTLTWNLARVRAAHAWYGLGLDGSGATIAIMDSGVDFTHPSLAANYRGQGGDGLPVHSGNWFDAVEGNPAPVDPHGHGTHVAGIAVGQDGIGVAPGARWIGVRMIDAFGFGYVSDIHEAFQWLLAPEGDPGLSPDVVNGSWSGHPELRVFEPDLAALRLAGIVPVFAAGNGGPADGTVGSPASYADAIAVGASDDLDQTTWFSSRGPSRLTAAVKPALLAPGAAVLSARPGGGYGLANGTSMAAPHVAGAYALLRAADPLASIERLTEVILSTAVPVEPPHPNSASGWGRLDVYAAASTLAPQGALAGTVQGAGRPLPEATVTVTTPLGQQLAFVTAESGNYEAWLQPGLYRLDATAYGYEEAHHPDLEVRAGSETRLDLELVRLPYGALKGTVREAGSGEPLAVELRLLDTPVSARSGPDGAFALEAPTGSYRLATAATGYRSSEHAVTIVEGQVTGLDLLLDTGPRVLLVDSGRWYYDSQIAAYVDGLRVAGYSHDLWTIRDPFYQVPTTATLSAYDVVVWSAPSDAPALLDASNTLAQYLADGGNLLISGQDVGELEGSFAYGDSYWWRAQLEADFSGNAEPPFVLAGDAASIFAGVTLELNGPDSVAAQRSPDQLSPRPGSLTRPALRYTNGAAGALQAGLCQPFKIIHLGFGLEGVDGAGQRAELVGRSFDHFEAPPVEAGLEVGPKVIDELAPPGEHLTYTIEIRNLSETVTDTFAIDVSGAGWPVLWDLRQLTLGPCGSNRVDLVVYVPEDLERDIVESFTVEVRSLNAPAHHQQVNITLKTPGRLLLVDDDRWYDQEPVFRAAVQGAGLTYDFWDTQVGPRERGGPRQSLLNAYDTVIWYTGYDWFRPVTGAESASLATYLAQGGRLLLTSQDYMYYHRAAPLTRDYLGVVAYQESITPTIVYQGDYSGPYSSLGDSLALNYGAYQNHGDGLVGAPSTTKLMWHDAGMPGALGNAGPGWRTVFWAVPLEKLPVEEHAPAISQSLGWLSDLGESTFTVDQNSGARHGPDSRRTYTLILHNSGQEAVEVAAANDLPAALRLDAASLSGGARYDRAAGRISWSGTIGPGQSHAISYQARPGNSSQPEERIDNAFSIHLVGQELRFWRSAPLWIEGPDLSPSSLTVRPLGPDPDGEVEVLLRLQNDGRTGSPFQVTLWLREPYFQARGEPSASTGRAWAGEGLIGWQGELAPGQAATLTVVVQPQAAVARVAVPLAALIDDGQTAPLIRYADVDLTPRSTFLPAISR
jgi:hypothetical protein